MMSELSALETDYSQRIAKLAESKGEYAPSTWQTIVQDTRTEILEAVQHNPPLMPLHAGERLLDWMDNVLPSSA